MGIDCYDVECVFRLLCWCREIGAKRKRDAADKAAKDEEDRKTAKERWGRDELYC